jgi:hypothetical protein
LGGQRDALLSFEGCFDFSKIKLMEPIVIFIEEGVNVLIKAARNVPIEFIILRKVLYLCRELFLLVLPFQVLSVVDNVLDLIVSCIVFIGLFA